MPVGLLIFLGIGALALLAGGGDKPTADRPKRSVPKRRKRGSVSASGGEPESPAEPEPPKPEPAVPQGEPAPASPEGPRPEAPAAVG